MHGRPTPQLAAIVACLCLIVAAPALAQPRERGGGDRRARALELFRHSEDAYREGRFDEAAALLREAHGLHPEPILQYNLARALEGMGDRRGAVTAYEHYLSEATDVQDRGAILQRVATLRREIAERESLEEERTEAERRRREAEQQLDREESDDARRAEEERRASESPEPARSPSVLPWIIAGAGAAAIGAGVFFGLEAQSKHEDAMAEPVQRTAAEAQQSAETSALVANVCFIAGGVLAAAGITWGIVDLSSAGGEGGEVALRVGPGGIAMLGALP